MTDAKSELFPCPCCGTPALGEVGGYEICDTCGWEDDPVQSRDPDFGGGANTMSLNEARRHWVATGTQVT